MEIDNYAFCPMPEPPKELAAALGWRLNPSPEEIEEQASMDLFARSTSISNPWLAKPGENGVIQFGDDDAREAREYAAAIEPVAKLFTPKETVSNVHSYSRALPVEQDDDEKIYFAALAPIQKLFHPDVTTTTSGATSHQFTKRATVPAPEAPLEKSGTGLDTFSEELEAGLQEALDQAIEDCLPSEDESTFDFFRRVDRRLEALGHRPILSVPTWTTTAY